MGSPSRGGLARERAAGPGSPAVAPAPRDEAGALRDTPAVHAAWERTLECLNLRRHTAILFQCPASFRATEENVANMRSFFGRVDRPEGARFMWEPRGPWPDDPVQGLCRELGLVHAVDPFVRPSLTAEPIYWRLHGNKSHCARCTDDELRQIHAWFPTDPGTECYVLFNEVPRAHDVRRFRELGLDREPSLRGGAGPNGPV